MKAGFIGAGKVGFSLGKYLKEGGVTVTGYYSRSDSSAREAAVFTDTEYYGNLTDIVRDSDTLFVTVPDGVIGNLWEEMRNLPIKDKNICHCSGSISSTVFFDAEEKGAFAYSVHPLYAISDKGKSYKGLKDACFAVEGTGDSYECRDCSADKEFALTGNSEKAREHFQLIKTTFEKLGNKVIFVPRDKKDLYHCAAAIVSNHIAALADIGAEMLTLCGFNRNDAQQALSSLIEGNAKKVADLGPQEALTGPVERGDVITVKKHLKALKALDKEQEEIYRLLSERLVKIAERKHPERDYGLMKECLKNY